MAGTVPAERRMVNEIAVAFQHLPETEAAEAVARHIRSFWDPRMRARLAEFVASGAEGFNPVALAAARIVTRPDGAAVG
ncbi:formate dehydrogenase subunit delta [Streptomyces tagetis]|uniref:Formate dehydrogenase subunit delta n=1 Tax=Streptomyces tagetis TaxID=2820809 RepID=A0A940XLA5_9ACTN|nr:formate dehydrogenase subunit delta [Streptomyces sp. RG38]MBQ0830505.1 formate dehydrogenase subunit delta [Streptomyces sp. RG38]